MKKLLFLAVLTVLFSSSYAQDKPVIAKEGETAPDFKVTTLEGKEVSLSDYEGKVVYVDFWASWCGPCRREMPHSEKIKKHFKGKDVVFLNVSVDRNEKAWKNMVKQLNVGGVNAIATGDELGRAAYSYQLSGIPAFVLIDKNGKVVFTRAKRPSTNMALIADIEKLL